MKAGARAIGAERLAAICTDIEDAAAARRADTLRDLRHRFEAELDAVYRFLDSQ
jgi:HPt (histidine-containing phosphotransfer) domain-containing protein